MWNVKLLFFFLSWVNQSYYFFFFEAKGIKGVEYIVVSKYLFSIYKK